MKPILFLLLVASPLFLYSADYYWVGGSGDWSDISHWAAESGGSVTYAQAPGSEDNVIFDANSFSAANQTVTVNTDIVFFRDMDWTAVTNNPSFIGPESATLNVYGSLALSSNMTFTFGGETRFLSEEVGNNIGYAGHPAGYNVVFTGGGGWQFTSPVAIDSSLSILAGDLNTNDQPVTVRHLSIGGSASKTVNLGASVVTITGKFLDTYRSDDEDVHSLRIRLDNLTLDPGTSRIELTAANPAFWIMDEGTIDLNFLHFSSTEGRAIMSSSFYQNDVNVVDLVASASTTFLTDFDAQVLSIAGGNVYEFLAEETYELGAITGDGTCARGLIMTSTMNGSESNFELSSGNIDLEYVTLRDIHASGGIFTATQGVDLGNNAGWDFTGSASADYYWIGGNGNWTDPAHWSFSSGGPSSGCVPSGKDNVFFDANSFTAANQFAVVNRPNVYMHDMTWRGVTNSGGLSGDPDFRVRVTGSLEFDENMDHSFEGYYHFETSESGKTIRSNGIRFNREVFFSGLTAEWTFMDEIQIEREINFLSGNLVTNGQQVTALGLRSRVETSRNLNITGSHILLRPVTNFYPYWEISNQGYELEASGSTIEFIGQSGSFTHFDYSELPAQNYDTLLWSTNESYIYSDNWFTDADVPAVIVDHLIYNGDGYVDGSNYFRKMELSGGGSYAFSGRSDNAQQVDELVASGDCGSGLTQLFSTIRSQRAVINVNQDYTQERMSITDINFSGGMVMANNSLDGGNNVNVTFTEITGRTLYWVGDGGFWQDPAHWSLISGGPGGECIPTSIDDVFFDENSFSMPGQEVDSYGTRFRNCHDITWTGTTNMPSFVNWYVNPTGSVTYDNSFNNYTWRTIFTGDEVQTVTSGGQMFNWIEIRNLGEVEFVDDLALYQFSQHSGSFSFRDINVVTDRIFFEFEVPKVANFGASRVNVRGEGDLNNPPFSNYSSTLTLNAGTSTVEFSGFDTGFQDYSDLEFHNVVFSNPESIGRMINVRFWEDPPPPRLNVFNSVVFSSDGETHGNFLADTLVGAAGKTYVFDAEENFDVNEYLQMIGNNCTPIEMRSSASGSKALMMMPASGEVVADFIQMQDMEASGGADFNAGARSVDIGVSNVGWTFQDAPNFVESGFLGADRALCTGEDLVLDAYSFSPNEQYLWSDGSVDSILSVDAPGIYFVEVAFESSCILRDTIEIFTAQDIMAMLPAGETICEGSTLALDATVPIATAEYLWSNGSTEPVIEVSEAGDYSVDIDVDGCVSSAFSTISIIENPGLDLGGDRSVCSGEEFTLSTDVMASSFLWQDGSTGVAVTSVLEGLYWLEISFNSCVFRDSAVVTNTPRPVVDLGGDVSSCSNQELVLSVSNPSGHAVTWQDGSMADEITVTDEGIYKVVVDANGCSSQDSIFVTILDAPLVDLGEDVEECEGEELFISVPDPTADFIWTDGSTDMDRMVSESGVYILEVEEDGCTGRDSIMVNFLELPILELGNDTTVCDDADFVVSPLVQTSGELVWGDGSTGPSFSANSTGLVRATLTDGACSSVDSVQVFFKDCITFSAYVPNAFSPNDDGMNDLLEVFFSEGLVIESYEIKVFDRWGNKVFASRVHENSWDGKFGSVDLDTGVYIYVINVEYIDDFGPGSEQIKGDVTIVN